MNTSSNPCSRTFSAPNLCRLGMVAGTLILFALAAVVFFYPIRFGQLRVCIAAGLFALWGLLLGLLWKRRAFRLASFAAVLLPTIFLLAPSRSENIPALRARYIGALQSYEGTPYVWGGETRRGLDCSGLVRRGFIDANRQRGLQTLNPALVRSALDLWFFDASAKALGEGDWGRTRLIFRAPSLNALDYSRLLPGDIAVTTNGVHTLAYLGDKTWIEADPGEWKVIRVRVPSKIGWFKMPMRIMRWQQLSS